MPGTLGVGGKAAKAPLRRKHAEPPDRHKGKGGISGSPASKEPEVREVFLHYGGRWLRVGEPGQLWGVGESLEEVARVIWGRVGGKVLECRAGNIFLHPCLPAAPTPGGDGRDGELASSRVRPSPAGAHCAHTPGTPVQHVSLPGTHQVPVALGFGMSSILCVCGGPAQHCPDTSDAYR